MSLGSNGDLYVNSENGDYYAKVEGAWVLKGNLREFVPSKKGASTAKMVRLHEFAAIAQLKISTAYVYHSKKLFEFPPPKCAVGRTLFWERATAVAWARKHKRLAARSKSHG